MSRQVHAVSRGICQAVVDSLEFARDGRSIAGEVPLTALGRLVDVLVDGAGALAVELHGERDEEGKSFLVLRVRGNLKLRCQRCLEALDFALDVDTRLQLVAPGEEWPDEELADDGTDAIEASRELAVLPLVEDEVLLALPIVARHEHCRPPMAAETESKPSPFAALAKLKDH